MVKTESRGERKHERERRLFIYLFLAFKTDGSLCAERKCLLTQLAHYWWLLANDNNGIEECEQQCSLLSSDALRTEGWQRADTVARPPELAMPERAPIAPHGSTRSRCCMCGLQDKLRPNEHEKIQVVVVLITLGRTCSFTAC